MARFVLAWFVLFVSASVASPLIKPVDLQLVCSALGANRLVDRETAGAEDGVAQGLTVDCPACLPGLVPGPAPALSVWFTVLSPALVPAVPPVDGHAARPTPFAARAPPVLT